LAAAVFILDEVVVAIAFAFMHCLVRCPSAVAVDYLPATAKRGASCVGAAHR
jgi:hypothetical protein